MTTVSGMETCQNAAELDGYAEIKARSRIHDSWRCIRFEIRPNRRVSRLSDSAACAATDTTASFTRMYDAETRLARCRPIFNCISRQDELDIQ
jgi:hypothetical protein